jgi:hypothetical protein
MAESSTPDTHSASIASTAAGHHEAADHAEVRYERSDVGARGVTTFVLALAALLIICSVFLYGMFRFYESGQAATYKRSALPLAGGERSLPPSTPGLEGVNPAEDVRRAWPEAASTEGTQTWLGYNVRIVPSTELPADGASAEERDKLATQAMAAKLQKVEATINELAGKLRTRQGAKDLPPDGIRSSPGQSNAGRSAGEKSP